MVPWVKLVSVYFRTGGCPTEIHIKTSLSSTYVRTTDLEEGDGILGPCRPALKANVFPPQLAQPKIDLCQNKADSSSNTGQLAWSGLCFHGLIFAELSGVSCLFILINFTALLMAAVVVSYLRHIYLWYVHTYAILFQFTEWKMLI